MPEEALRQLPAVTAALNAATEQLQNYRNALLRKFPEAKPRCYAVVAVGLERMVGGHVE